MDAIIKFNPNTKKLQIKDSNLLHKMLLTNKIKPDELNLLMTYGKKNIKDKNLPKEAVEDIVLYALAKAINTYDSSKNTAFTTFFVNKIKGVESDYKNTHLKIKRAKDGKTSAEVTKEAAELQVKNLMQYAREMGGKIELNKEDKEAKEDKNIVYVTEPDYVEDDYARRQEQAFKTAYAMLPYKYQYILWLIADDNLNIPKTAKKLDMPESYLRSIKNAILSMLLELILNSNHLKEEEKEEILKAHNLVSANKKEEKSESEENIENNEDEELIFL